MEYTPGVCNIDTQGQRQRAIFGMSFISVGVLITILLVFVRISPWWMGGVGLFFWAGMLGIVQAKSKFCVSNAAKTQYEVKGKMTPIKDNNAHNTDQRRARILHVQAFLTAVLLTAIATLIMLWLRT